MPRVTIVHYGVGNVRSLAAALEALRAEVRISAEPADVAWAERLILPGVGAFDAARERLSEPHLAGALGDAVLDRQTPALGICLGLQLLTRSSEEGHVAGLGWIDAETHRLVPDLAGRRRIPHLGWAEVVPRRDDPLLARLPGPPQFYFAHSYYVACRDPGDVVAVSLYGQEFAAVVRHGSWVGVQFHPERSQRVGRQVLANFLEWG